jgi:hypothetical protein
MPKFIALLSALAASVATLAIPASIYAAPEEKIAIASLAPGHRLVDVVEARD